jgi:polyphosphate glucokinase
MAHVLGIDIGGTGIKAAPVETDTGKLMADRQKLATPQPATPDAVEQIVRDLVKDFSWTGPAGITFPGVVTKGVIQTAANVDHSWIGVDAVKTFGASTQLQVTMINDADAAGVAEMRFGAGKGVTGTVLMLTLGTGIGSALFIDGLLVPNTEFGHVEIRGKDAEKRASELVREEHELSWEKWSARVDEVLTELEALLSPGLFIIGGGISRKSDKFVPLLTGLRARVVPAALLNDAGIVGAAISATGTELIDLSTRHAAARPQGS